MTKTALLPLMADLRNWGSVPRVHPNGFIQLDLNANLRLHVWHPNLPYRQKTYHPIHDHTFGFTSHVYSGRMVHVVYDTVPSDDGTHIFWRGQKRADEETILKTLSDEPPVNLVFIMAEVVQPGQSYSFEPFRFHESLSNEPTLTIIKKQDKPWPLEGITPRIVVPIGVEPDNTFVRADVDQEVLWKLISEAHPE